jgi:hypothetical protein
MRQLARNQDALTELAQLSFPNDDRRQNDWLCGQWWHLYRSQLLVSPDETIGALTGGEWRPTEVTAAMQPEEESTSQDRSASKPAFSMTAPPAAAQQASTGTTGSRDGGDPPSSTQTTTGHESQPPERRGKVIVVPKPVPLQPAAAEAIGVQPAQTRTVTMIIRPGGRRETHPHLPLTYQVQQGVEFRAVEPKATVHALPGSIVHALGSRIVAHPGSTVIEYASTKRSTSSD